MEEDCFERLSPTMEICVSRIHRFGTDAFLLADFAEGAAGETACDLCSGCGIVACLLLRGDKAPERVAAVEIQGEAVALLERTVARSGLTERLIPLHSDLRKIPGGDLARGSCALVTCNPPYKAMGAGILSARQADMLARHEEGCTLEDVCKSAGRLLRFGGRLCLCQRPERLPDVLEAMRGAGLEPKRLRMVQKQADTSPWLVLAEGRKGSRPFMTVMPPLLMQDAQGAPSPEIRRIYGIKEG